MPAAERAPRRGRGAALAYTFALALSLPFWFAACQGGSGGAAADAVTVNGDVPIAYVQRSSSLVQNPTEGAGFAPGGDLFVREKSSASAPEHNLTARYTQGVGDASKPEVSYDGKTIVFALNCPVSNTATVDGTPTGTPACTGHWNIWEYRMNDLTPAGLVGGTFRRLTASTQDDDVDPVYLPAGGGIVFSSNRQASSHLNQALGHAYYAADEYERQRVFNLHRMKADGSAIEQITFNQSHDRKPTIRPNGDIMFSRWEHVAARNRFAIFRAKPDGTDLFVLYGAHSAGNSYLNPRDMDPKGAYAGQVLSTLMPLSKTHEGGALHLIDIANYSEDDTPATSQLPAIGGQREITARPINDGTGLSPAGRAATPYPLWDGTDRVLVAWRPCEVLRSGVVVPCTSLSAAEVAQLQDPTRTQAQIESAAVQDKAPPDYAIYLFDPQAQTWLIVAAPPSGHMNLDPVALAPRSEPAVVQPTVVDPALAAQGLGLIEVRSVYDTDGLQRMAEPMLVAGDHPGCALGIAQTAPADPNDTRSQVADLARIKDPADPAYGCAPARFIRATRAVAPPSGAIGVRAAIGQTDFEPAQILGYAMIEPDGSFKLQVPADTPLAFSVVDAQGRGIQTHTNWIQVRPGERRTCDGCHSPRRGAAINSGAIVDRLPAALQPALASQHQAGETMASTRARLDAGVLQLAGDPVYADLWADTTRAGVTARPAISLRYTGNPVAADDLATPAPAAGVINYPQHVQPLWSRDRGANTCTNCHAGGTRPNLGATIAGTGRLASYEALTVGDPVIGADGQPQVQLVDGVPEIVRGPTLVDTDSGDVNSAGQARKSRLTEILWGQKLLARAAAVAAFPSPPATAPDHAAMLNRAEKRLLAEWIDLGGQYYNDPFDAASGVRTVAALPANVFAAQIEPVLLARCAACHQAGLGDPQNRFVLTGAVDGDYNVTLSVVTDTCHVAANPLLARPSTMPHPAGAIGQTGAVLPAGSADYATLAAWIASGCPAP
ncbi:MAG: hypothetical protein KGN16_02430 [Burkholderiales bacterium]|nr:hypothetical protein [Burkholderiales bacterium]